MTLLTLTLVAHAATEAHGAAQSAGIGALGLDWRSLLFQVVNFTILLVLLRKFAYRPIVNVLEQRRQTIEESLQNAHEIEETKAALEKDKQAALAAARTRAQEIVAQSKVRAQEIVTSAEAEATERAAQLVSNGEAQLKHEVSSARRQLRGEALELVAAATEKIIDVKLDSTKDAALLERAVREVARA